VVLVTHEQDLASRAQRLIRLADGVVVEDRTMGAAGATGAVGAA
jgi:ABC-type lipoprotein export system ATPase subunit